MKKFIVLGLVLCFASAASANTLYLNPVVGNNADNLAYVNLDGYQSGEDYYDEGTVGPPTGTGRVYDASTNPSGSMSAFAEATPDNTTAYIDVWCYTQNDDSWVGGAFTFTVSGGTVAGAYDPAGPPQPIIGEIGYANQAFTTGYSDAVSYLGEAFSQNTLYPKSAWITVPGIRPMLTQVRNQ